MKKIVSPLASGGAPFTNEVMQTVFNQEIWTAMESIFQGVSDPAASGNIGVIVSGCKITGSGPYNCSSGIVYLNGQFMAFPGFTGQSLPQYIVPATITYTTKVWNNGTTNNLISQQDATYQNSTPGSGQYISLTTLGAQGSLGGQRGLITPWQTLTLKNSWTNSSTPTARWRFVGFGLIELALNIVTPAGLSTNFADIPAAWGNQTSWGNALYLPCATFRSPNFLSSGNMIQINNNSGTINIQVTSGFTLTSGDIFKCSAIFSIDNQSV